LIGKEYILITIIYVHIFYTAV